MPCRVLSGSFSLECCLRDQKLCVPLPDETVSIYSIVPGLVPEVLVLARSVSLLAINKCASPQPREEAYRSTVVFYR